MGLKTTLRDALDARRGAYPHPPGRVYNESVSGAPLVAHVIDELKTGGAQTHLLTMLREAQPRYRARHQVLSLMGDGPMRKSFEAVGIPVECLDLRSRLGRRDFLGASREVGRVLRSWRPEIVEAHLTWSRLLALPPARSAGARLRIGFEQGDVYNDSLKFRVANFLGQAFADHIIVCSEALADWVHRTHRVRRAKLRVYHNCVDTETFAPGAQEASPTDARLPECDFLFCAVGTLGSGVNKRVDVLIRALAKARETGADIALVICGDGDQRPELERLSRELGLTGAVSFLGNRGDIPRILRASDAFCHGAPFEPFGIVCIEAMAAGLPVVVPSTGGMREAVVDSETGLIYEALSTDSLARAMGLLAADAQLCARLAESGRAMVEQEFSSKTYIDRLYRLYGLAPC